MADLLVERVTGRSIATAAPITVNLVISDRTLFDAGAEPAHVSGFGPVPAALARDWVKNAATDDSIEVTDDSTAAHVELRRVYAHPGSGALTGLESKAGCFPAGLARWINTRDQMCRTPWCDAPIRHVDHIEPRENGGPTTADNGAGLCEACNHAKQGAGWTAKPARTKKRAARHCYSFTTPSGHEYRSTAPRLPKPLLHWETEYYKLGADVPIDYWTLERASRNPRSSIEKVGWLRRLTEAPHPLASSAQLPPRKMR